MMMERVQITTIPLAQEKLVSPDMTIRTDVTLEEDRIVSVEEEIGFASGSIINKYKETEVTTEKIEKIEGPETTDVKSEEAEVELKIPRSEDLNNIDNFGFFVDKNKSEKNLKDAISIVSESAKNIRKTESKWIDILNNWQSHNPSQIKLLCRQGVPNSLRAKVWQLTSSFLTQNVDLNYKDYIYDNDIYEIIQRDIDRSYPDHYFFQKGTQGQSDLFDILKAYANYNKDVGYCQGMGRLAGLLLMIFPPAESFNLLVKTIKIIPFYSPTLEYLRIQASVFDYLLYKKLPRVHKFLKQEGVDVLVYITPWFMTLFTMTLKWECVLRIVDMFYCEGIKVLHRTALAIFTIIQRRLFKQKSMDVFQLLLHPEEYITEDKLLKALFQVKLSRSDIKNAELKVMSQWGKEYEERGVVNLTSK